MKYNRCGNSGLLLPAVSLGGWHHFETQEKARALALCAFESGVAHIDMANNYGPPPGAAESNLGGVLSSDLVCHRDELVISTKAGYDMWGGPYGSGGSRKHLLASLDQSLKRLRLDYVDIYYSHRFDPSTPLFETMGALHSAVVSGKALYPAISNYPPDAAKDAAKIMEDLGTPLLIHQCSYSMLNRTVEDETLRRAEKRGMGFAAFSPLAQGLLSPRYLSGVPDDSRAAQNVFLKRESIDEPLLKKIKKLSALAVGRGQTLNRLAVQWCLRDSRVTTVIVGARNPEQLRDNIMADSDTALSESEIAAIETILADGKKSAEVSPSKVPKESVAESTPVPPKVVRIPTAATPKKRRHPLRPQRPDVDQLSQAEK